jgi:hypothetical protein
MVNKSKKHQKNNRSETKQPSGYKPRGARGSQREKLAKAAGFRSDNELTELFSASGYNLKLITDLQRVLTKLLKDKSPDELLNSPVTHHYAGLIHALSGSEITNSTIAAAGCEQSTPDPSEQRNSKQAGLATEALRQVVIEAAETPLSMIPSLVADTSLSDKEKIQRLAVYTRSLEMLYEPLQLEPIGDPGEKTTFNPRFHESGANISSGDPCLIKRIGFTKGDSVIRKAVVEEVQE